MKYNLINNGYPFHYVCKTACLFNKYCNEQDITQLRNKKCKFTLKGARRICILSREKLIIVEATNE